MVHRAAYVRVPVSQEDLRRAVLESTTEGVEELAWLHEGRTAKVNEFHVETSVHDDVLVLIEPNKQYKMCYKYLKSEWL